MARRAPAGSAVLKTTLVPGQQCPDTRRQDQLHERCAVGGPDPRRAHGGNADASISPRTKRSSSGQSGCIRGLAQLVRVPGGELETVDRLQRLYLLEGRGGEGRLALEGVQHDALEQIAERQVELGGERLEHLEQAALEAHSGLGTGDFFHEVMVPSYQATIKSGVWRRHGHARDCARRLGARAPSVNDPRTRLSVLISGSMQTARDITGYRRHWAERFGTAPFLPMSRAEMDQLGWDSCDVIIVTGDAYVDHPSFGMAIIGRVLEAQGFRVGIIAQPDWQSAEPFKVLGKPNLFFGVTGGNMDSMVNRYTSDRRLRHNDSYTPGGLGGKRPDRSVLVYAQRCREAYRDVPIVLGGIESSLRRIAHYDYWSDKVRRSILADAKGDILLYGNAERAVVEVTHRLARGAKPAELEDIRGIAILKSAVPEGWTE